VQPAVVDVEVGGVARTCRTPESDMFRQRQRPGSRDLGPRRSGAATSTGGRPFCGDAALDHFGDVLEAALDVDLGDGFRFEAGAARPMTAETDEGGLRYAILARLDGREFERIQLDIDAVPDDQRPLERLELRDLLHFAGIAPPSIPVIPLAQHLADKLHAHVRDYRSRANSRCRPPRGWDHRLASSGTTSTVPGRRTSSVRVRRINEEARGAATAHPQPSRRHGQTPRRATEHGNSASEWLPARERSVPGTRVVRATRQLRKCGSPTGGCGRVTRQSLASTLVRLGS